MNKLMLVAAAAAWATAGAAAADVMSDLGLAGSCWTRTYDAAHMRAHPRQVVSRFGVLALPAEAGQGASVRWVQFGFRSAQTDELNIGVAECRAAGAGALCTAAQDVGTFRLDARPNGVLRLSVVNSLAGERPDGLYTSNLAASDDRVFDLRAAPAGSCDVG